MAQEEARERIRRETSQGDARGRRGERGGAEEEARRRETERTEKWRRRGQ